ncbi:MAG: helix-turn-helix domain-containing protein [Opitutales bacterium]|nr:helix-turn-helix domain-containing protein [Opitutales bacterium]
MKNLGAKLKAAREAKELSLKDVHEATKLRVDMLENLENGIFDDKLAEIYRGGFLRIYASFLKFDEKEIMREYKTAMAMRPSEEYRPQVSVVPSEEEVPQPTKFNDVVEDDTQVSDNTTKYIKMGGVFVLTILTIIILAMMISSLMSSDKKAIDDDATIQNQPQQVVEHKEEVKAPINDVVVQKPVLVISAYADTYVTVSKPMSNAAPLFTATIKGGTTKEFPLEEALMVRVLDASKIKMMKNSQVIYDKTLTGVRVFNVSAR